MCKIKLSDLKKKGQKYIDQYGDIMEITDAMFTVKSQDGHTKGMSLDTLIDDVDSFLPEQEK